MERNHTEGLTGCLSFIGSSSLLLKRGNQSLKCFSKIDSMKERGASSRNESKSRVEMKQVGRGNEFMLSFHTLQLVQIVDESPGELKRRVEQEIGALGGDPIRWAIVKVSPKPSNFNARDDLLYTNHVFTIEAIVSMNSNC